MSHYYTIIFPETHLQIKSLEIGCKMFQTHMVAITFVLPKIRACPHFIFRIVKSKSNYAKSGNIDWQMRPIG